MIVARKKGIFGTGPKLAQKRYSFCLLVAATSGRRHWNAGWCRRRLQPKFGNRYVPTDRGGAQRRLARPPVLWSSQPMV
jgi:hypothetical protein